MAEQVHRQSATLLTSTRTLNSGLSICEIEQRHLWSIQTNRNYELAIFARAIFGDAPQIGEMLGADALRLLQLWPHKAYLLSTQPDLPDSLHRFSSMLTDISHGFCELSLGGEQALEFLASHASADLMQTRIAETRNLRCLLGQYQVTLWWDRLDDIRILVERSCAISFCDYLEHLLQRWS